FNLSNNDVFLQKTSYCFDPSIWEFFCPLILGAKLVLVPSAKQFDIIHIINLMQQHQVSIIDVVPSFLQFLLEQNPDLPSLKIVLSGGEILSPSLQKRFYDHFKETILYNTYGPTEASI